MNEFQEKPFQDKPKIMQAVPVVTHPVDTEYRSVVHERPRVSGVAIAALVVAGIAVAVLITMLIMNNQQRTRDEELAQDRARAAAAQQSSAQQSTAQPSQQSPVIVMPSTPATTSGPVPSSYQPAPALPARSSVEIELDVTSKFVDDPELHSYPLDVKFASGIVTLSGEVPNDALKTLAEKLARKVKGVESVINNITVQSQS